MYGVLFLDKYEKFEKIMYIVLLVAWCGGVACRAENKEKWEMRLVVVKENFSPSFSPVPPSLPCFLPPPFPSFLKRMQAQIACTVLF